MPAPADALEVVCALRLGWYLAEAPGKPGARSPHRAVVAEVRKRTLTTVGDAAVP